MRQRDSQKSKVYAAEWLLDSEDKQHNKLTLAQCNDFVKKVQSRTALREEFGWRLTDPITVHSGAGNRRASANLRTRTIKLPKWARNEFTILHEIAHLVTADYVAAHGVEFATNLLRLVRSTLGVEAAEHLAAAFNLKGVKVLSNGKARTPRVPKSQAGWHAAQKERLDRVKAEKKAQAALDKQVVETAVTQQSTVACPQCGDHSEVKVRHYQVLKGWNYVTKATVSWECPKEQCCQSVYRQLTPSLVKEVAA